MVTWTRADLKNWAKEALHRNYWRMVLVGFIMLIITGGLSGGSSSSFNRITENLPVHNEISVDTDTMHLEKEFRNTIDEIGNSMDGATTAMAGGIIFVVFIVFLVVIAISVVLSLFLIQPLLVGGRRFFSRSLVEDAQLQELTYAFSHNYLNVVKNMFLMNLFIGLWSLLLVIPGIVKKYEYRMVPYLLGEHPEMTTKELFDTSREMMRGQKWASFVLDLSFIGWCILGGMTCGILFIFWVTPYQWLTNAALYRELSGSDRTYGPQGGFYGQNDYQSFYSKGNPYGQNDAYTQGNVYSQNDTYTQGNSYDQTSAYDQNGQNTPYGQDYYTQNDVNNQGSSYDQSDYNNQ